VLERIEVTKMVLQQIDVSYSNISNNRNKIRKRSNRFSKY